MLNYQLERAATVVAKYLLELPPVTGVHIAPLPAAQRKPTHRLIAIVDDERHLRYLDELESTRSLTEAALRVLGQEEPSGDSRRFIERILNDRSGLGWAEVQVVTDALELATLRSRWRLDADRLDRTTYSPGRPFTWRHAAQHYKVYVPIIGQFDSH